MIKKLRTKFVCINMALVMTMLAVCLVLVYRFTASNLESSSVSALVNAMESQRVPGRPGTGSTHLTFVLAEEPDGSILVIGGEYFDLSDREMVKDIYLQAKDQEAQVGVISGYALRFYREKGIWGDRYCFIDITAELSALRSLVRVCALIAVGGFVGFLVISILLARWAIRPVEQAWQQQRQFVADASHELKTPLTVILTNAEMLRSPEYGPEEKSRFTDSILEETQQMRGLVENLLQLARTDRGTRKGEMVRLELSALTENCLLPFEPVYFEHGLTLESSIEPGLFVMGDQKLLRQVMSILLDNGRKYSAPGGTAVLTLSRQGKKAVLKFFTPGEPLTPQQCQDVFKRFYRVDEARTTNGSYGLGLSIAAGIVGDHGGRIWAEGTEGGNTFCVALPES